MPKTEIYILSGFLGSGKTTLLKRILLEEQKLNRRVAVMMNELGKISIDSDEVGDEVPLKELLDGCVCCTIQDKLEAQLQSLLLDEKPEVIYIETTGAAHPVEVLDAVLSPLFANELNVKGIVTIVDGNQWLNRKSYSPQIQQLLIEQVRHAHLILLNKADQLSEGDQAKLVMEIQGVNRNALSILTTYAKVSLQQIKNIQFTHTMENLKTHVQTDLQLSTFVYQFEHGINQELFEHFLRSLPETIYRIKGYIKFTHSEYPYLFQYSYGMPLYMKEYMNLPLNLVFIGENIDWMKIEGQLAQLEQNR